MRFKSAMMIFFLLVAAAVSFAKPGTPVTHTYHVSFDKAYQACLVVVIEMGNVRFVDKSSGVVSFNVARKWPHTDPQRGALTVEKVSANETKVTVIEDIKNHQFNADRFFTGLDAQLQ